METLLAGLEQVATLPILMLIIAGTVAGVVVGVLPGLGSVIGITMTLPFTLAMGPVPALALMLSVYCASVYGGSITAIMLNTPGTPQAAATALEGFPMARRGEAPQAIGWATVASTFGGLFSVAVLILAAPQLAEFSLNFTAIEYFSLGVFALICIASVSGGAMLKGLLSGVIGLFLAVVGADPISGSMRFTFESFELSAGITLIPTIIGLFALSEVFVRASERHLNGSTKIFNVGFVLPPCSAWKGRLSGLIKSSSIGSFVGALPGTGAATAAFISYAEAKRSSKNRDHFGSGEPDGLIASESANNAVTGSALVPTLALGIPGDPVMAVMLGAFIVQGIAPGPQLFINNLDLVYAIFLILIMANICMLLVGAFGARLFTRVLRIPEPILMGAVLILALVGSYAVRGNSLDILITLGAGVAGFVLRKNGFPLAPMVIGMVLSPMIEISFRQGMLLTRGDFLAFFERPITLVLFALMALMLASPLIKKVFESLQVPRNEK